VQTDEAFHPHAFGTNIDLIHFLQWNEWVNVQNSAPNLCQCPTVQSTESSEPVVRL